MSRLFLSTLSLRRATNVRPEIHQLCAISIHALLAESDGCEQYCIRAREISIHALLAESDLENPARAFLTSYFYPRSPCGERPLKGS